MKVEYVNFGLANRFSDRIEVNKHLRSRPDLLKPILRHELEHTDKPFTFEDLQLDLSRNQNLSTKELIKFMIMHPSTLLQFFPFYWTKRDGFVYDLNMILIYLVMFTVISSTIFLSVKYL